MNSKLYDAWHERLGHREYRLTYVMSGYGADVDDAESFLDGFLGEHPDVGPVVSQDAAADEIAVTFSLRGKDPEHAVELGWVVFTDGGAASGLQPTTIVRIELEPVLDEADDTATAEQSLQPA